MPREEELIQKAKEVREGLIDMAKREIDATHIEVGQITAIDDPNDLLTIMIGGTNRLVPFTGHHVDEFNLTDYWAVIFEDDYGTIRLGWFVCLAGGGGFAPLTPHVLDPASGPHTGTLPEATVVFDDAAGHDHAGAGNAGKKVDHANLVNVLTGQHHAQLHKDAHKSGGGDAFAAADLHESIIKRLLESGGPTTLLMGVVGDGQYLKREGAGIVGVDTTDGGLRAIVWHVDGALATGTEVGEARVLPQDMTFVKAYIYCKTTGTAGSTIADIHKNGVTIFTTQGNRPSLAWNDPDKKAVTVAPDVTAGVEGDIMTIDIDAIATGAEDLVIVLIFAGILGGLPFGSCYGNHIDWVQAAAAQNTWYNISDAGIATGQLNAVTHDGNGKLTVTEPGQYLVTWSLCYEDDRANDHLEVGIEVTGSGAAEVAGRAHSENKFASEEEHLSSCAILDLADNATLELAIRTIDPGTPTITVDGMNLSAVMIRGG